MQARATSIKSGLPNAIYHLAQHSPGGLDLAFQDPTAFVNYTEQVYVRSYTDLPRAAIPDSNALTDSASRRCVDIKLLRADR